MDDRSLAFLKSLLDTPGPSGFEAAPARVWRAEAQRFADDVGADVGGNSLATINRGGAPRLMFAGHIDEIGLMVVHIDDEGYVHFDPIGGWDTQVFVGQRVLLLGRGGPVPGVIGKRAIHLVAKDDRDKVSKPEDLWIDIGAANRADAEARLRRVCVAVRGRLSVHATRRSARCRRAVGSSVRTVLQQSQVPRPYRSSRPELRRTALPRTGCQMVPA